MISQTLIDHEISHEKFEIIVYWKEKYEKMKTNIRMNESEKTDAEEGELNEEKVEKIKTNKLTQKHNENA